MTENEAYLKEEIKILQQRIDNLENNLREKEMQILSPGEYEATLTSVEPYEHRHTKAGKTLKLIFTTIYGKKELFHFLYFPEDNFSNHFELVLSLLKNLLGKKVMLYIEIRKYLSGRSMHSDDLITSNIIKRIDWG
jgi:hypothetical protein